MRHYIADLHKYEGQTVELKGWVYNTRSSGKIKFLELRDGTGICQCVYFRGECDQEAFENFKDLSQEMSVKVTGTVRKDNRFENVYEVGADNFEILGPNRVFVVRRSF